MDLLRMIAELRDEQQRLDEAIDALERLSIGNRSRRRSRSVTLLSHESPQQTPYSSKIQSGNPFRHKKGMSEADS